nr:ribonuclease HII [Secundilactobacillus oryzae]
MQTQKRIQAAALLEQQFQERLRYERHFWENGIEFVAGVDEVGRGPLAGPVVTGAVILPHDFDIPLVNDSKQLTHAERERLFPLILEQAVSVSIGVASSQLIDDINIYEATRVAMKQVVERLSVQPQQIIVDAMQIDVPIQQTRLIKGDAKSASVSAASIVAKVYRDHLMALYDVIYPGYAFAANAGYGTKDHLSGLASLGVTPIHRKSFSPVSKQLNVSRS